MDPMYLSLSIIILLFSVILHEVAHGLTARFFGDPTAENAGRLTLNPLPHIDPIGTILVPGILFLSGSGFLIGWAKPVPVNPLNFSNLSKGELLVSFAGPATNFLLVILGTILYHLFSPFSLGDTGVVIINLLRFLVTINLVLGIFNLLPIPPLDGSKVLLSQLPYNLAKEYQKLEPYGFFLIILLWMVPVGGVSLLGWIMRFLITIANVVLQVPLRLF